MSTARLRFGDFVLDTGSRSLLRDGVPVALNARYFDALALLLRERGRLVGKQQFFAEVWAGSVVTDAALTQCIKDVRRQLGDDANDPRYVRTVPGHGYCFIATVTEEGIDAPVAAKALDSVIEETSAAPARAAPVEHPPALPRPLLDVLAAGAGGSLAGLLGGLLYGSLLAFAPPAQGLGTLSVLLVLLALSVLVGLAGGLGVGLGLAAGQRLGHGVGGLLLGAALGGFAVGGLAKLLGSDTFTLLVGHAPTGITGGLEGAAIGLALAAGLALGGGLDAPRGARPVQLAALSTALAGVLVHLAGGGLMASSLAQVASSFEQSRLDLAPLARLFGEARLSLLARAGLGALEGAIFGGCVAAVLLASRRRRG